MLGRYVKGFIGKRQANAQIDYCSPHRNSYKRWDPARLLEWGFQASGPKHEQKGQIGKISRKKKGLSNFLFSAKFFLFSGGGQNQYFSFF